MKELFESLFGAYRGRYKNKFIGTFLLVYIALNWDKAIAIFFISEMSYDEFVSLWKLDAYRFFCGIGYAFIVSCVYLAISPWLSFVVHVAQSNAVTQYKIQTLKNDRMVFEEKQAMESARQEALALEQKNVESEAVIEESKEKLQNSDDKNKYLRIISALSEDRIREAISQITDDGSIDYAIYNAITDLANKIQSIENHFDSESLEKNRENYAEIIAVFASLLREYSESETHGYVINQKGLAIFEDIKNNVIPAYRNFYNAGRLLK